MLAELMTVDAATEPGLWLLRGSILGDLAQIVSELEAEEHRRAAMEVQRRRARTGLRRMKNSSSGSHPGFTGSP